jgi:hypothetical protein
MDVFAMISTWTHTPGDIHAGCEGDTANWERKSHDDSKSTGDPAILKLEKMLWSLKKIISQVHIDDNNPPIIFMNIHDNLAI